MSFGLIFMTGVRVQKQKMLYKNKSDAMRLDKLTKIN